MSKTTPNLTLEDLNNKLDTVIDTVNTAFTTVTGEIQEVKQRLGSLESTVGSVKATVNTLPTKDYLDQKLGTQKSDIVQLIRTEDQKVVALVHELRDTKVVSAPAAQRILAIKAFV